MLHQAFFSHQLFKCYLTETFLSTSQNQVTEVMYFSFFSLSRSYPQQFPQQGNQGQFGPMMMNNSMGGPGPVSGAGAGQMAQMPGQMQGQMGMNSMGMGRMPMGPDQVDNFRISHVFQLLLGGFSFVTVCLLCVFCRSIAEDLWFMTESGPFSCGRFSRTRRGTGRRRTHIFTTHTHSRVPPA